MATPWLSTGQRVAMLGSGLVVAGVALSALAGPGTVALSLLEVVALLAALAVLVAGFRRDWGRQTRRAVGVMGVLAAAAGAAAASANGAGAETTAMAGATAVLVGGVVVAVGPVIEHTPGESDDGVDAEGA